MLILKLNCFNTYVVSNCNARRKGMTIYCLLRRVCFCDSIQTLIPIIYSAVTRDFLLWFSIFLWDTEAVVWRCSVKKVFLEISQNSQENTCAGDSFLMELQASHLLEPHLYDKACTATFHLISYWILLLLSLCVWTVQYQLNTFWF